MYDNKDQMCIAQLLAGSISTTHREKRFIAEICGDEKIKENIELWKKLMEARTAIEIKMPFYGALLMVKLECELSSCLTPTVSTNGKKILWNPQFLKRISMDEIQYVMLHELLHCLLGHLKERKEKKIQKLYDIACDLVVDSILMSELDDNQIMVDRNFVLHVGPKGEGYNYNANEIYQMFCEEYKEHMDNLGKLYRVLERDYDGWHDDHDMWCDSEISEAAIVDEWKSTVKELAQLSTLKSHISPWLKGLLEEGFFDDGFKSERE